VDVPKDASDGVTMAATDGTRPAVEVSLPNANNAGDAQKVANGVVAYPSGNGSANAVQATEGGGVRMLTVIDNASAPTTYDYKITVPSGGHIELTQDGGAVVLGTDGQAIASVAPAWATDASSNPVHTYFTTDGKALIQHVDHNVSGVTYPVTADPQIGFGWYIYVRLSPNDQRFMVQNGPIVFGGTVCGYITKNPQVAIACATAATVVGNWLSVYYNPKHWVEIKFTYAGKFASIKRL
jgi:hypothetical protein